MKTATSTVLPTLGGNGNPTFVTNLQRPQMVIGPEESVQIAWAWGSRCKCGLDER